MKKLLAIAALLLIISSCYNDKYDKLYPTPVTTTTCDTTSISFSKDVAPIINTYCITGCHDASGSGSIIGGVYTSWAGISPQALNGNMVTDINWTPTGRNQDMPYGGLPKLPACDINIITRWVNEGAPNN